MRKSLGELREGLAKIRKELAEHFTDVEQNDRYGRQMWTFVGKASAQLEDLVDDVNHAESTFSEVISYYGEDEKSMNSAEFYGIFKTFVTSYRVRLAQSMLAYPSTDIVRFRNARQTIKASLRSVRPLRGGGTQQRNPELGVSKKSHPQRAMKIYLHWIPSSRNCAMEITLVANLVECAQLVHRHH